MGLLRTKKNITFHLVIKKIVLTKDFVENPGYLGYRVKIEENLFSKEKCSFQNANCYCLLAGTRRWEILIKQHSQLWFSSLESILNIVGSIVNRKADLIHISQFSETTKFILLRLHTRRTEGFIVACLRISCIDYEGNKGFLFRLYISYIARRRRKFAEKCDFIAT